MHQSMVCIGDLKATLEKLSKIVPNCQILWVCLTPSHIKTLTSAYSLFPIGKWWQSPDILNHYLLIIIDIVPKLSS